jgi:hypothetical protein
VHTVYKECADRGDLTSKKLRRDTIEPSSIEVKGVHRNNHVVSLERDRFTEHSTRGSSARCASSKENTRRERRIYFQEILQT